MRLWGAATILALLSVVVCMLCGCKEGGEQVTSTDAREDFRSRLYGIKPKLAAYLGLQEGEIARFEPDGVNPLTDEVARRYGLQANSVLGIRPLKLPPGQYTWIGRVNLTIKPNYSSRLMHEVTCFYDAHSNRWLIDRVSASVPAKGSEEDERSIIMTPITPAAGWTPY